MAALVADAGGGERPASPGKALRTSMLKEQFDQLQLEWCKVNQNLHRGNAKSMDGGQPRPSSTEHQRPSASRDAPSANRSASVGTSYKQPEGRQQQQPASKPQAGQARSGAPAKARLESIQERPAGAQHHPQQAAADRFKSPMRGANAPSASKPGEVTPGRAAATDARADAPASDRKQKEKKTPSRKWVPPPWNDNFSGLPVNVPFENLGPDQDQDKAPVPRQQQPHRSRPVTPQKGASSRPTTPQRPQQQQQQQASKEAPAQAKGGRTSPQPPAGAIAVPSDHSPSKIPSPGPRVQRSPSPAPAKQQPGVSSSPRSKIPHVNPAGAEPLKLSDDLLQVDDRLAGPDAARPRQPKSPQRQRKQWGAPSPDAAAPAAPAPAIVARSPPSSPLKPRPPAGPSSAAPVKRRSSSGSVSRLTPPASPMEGGAAPGARREVPERRVSASESLDFGDVPSKPKDEEFKKKLSVLKRSTMMSADARRRSMQESQQLQSGGGNAADQPLVTLAAKRSSQDGNSSSSMGLSLSGSIVGGPGAPRPPSAKRPSSGGASAASVPHRAPSPRHRIAGSGSTSMSMSSSIETPTVPPQQQQTQGQGRPAAVSAPATSAEPPVPPLQPSAPPPVPASPPMWPRLNSDTLDGGDSSVMMGSVVGSQIFGGGSGSPEKSSPSPTSAYRPSGYDQGASGPAPADLEPTFSRTELRQVVHHQPQAQQQGATPGAPIGQDEFLRYAIQHPDLAMAAAAAVMSTSQSRSIGGAMPLGPGPQPGGMAAEDTSGRPQRARWQIPEDAPVPTSPWDAATFSHRPEWQTPPSLLEQQQLHQQQPQAAPGYGPPPPDMPHAAPPPWQQQGPPLPGGPGGFALPPQYGGGPPPLQHMEQAMPGQGPEPYMGGAGTGPGQGPGPYGGPPGAGYPPQPQQMHQQGHNYTAPGRAGEHKPWSAGYVPPHEMQGAPDYMLQRSMSSDNMWGGGNPTWPGRGRGNGGPPGPHGGQYIPQQLTQQLPPPAFGGPQGPGPHGQGPRPGGGYHSEPPWAVDYGGPGGPPPPHMQQQQPPGYYGPPGHRGGGMPPQYPQQHHNVPPAWPSPTGPGPSAPGNGPWGQGPAGPSPFYGESPIRGGGGARTGPLPGAFRPPPRPNAFAQSPDLPEYLRISQSNLTAGFQAPGVGPASGALSKFADVWQNRQAVSPGPRRAEKKDSNGFDGLSLEAVLATTKPKKDPPFKANATARRGSGSAGGDAGA